LGHNRVLGGMGGEGLEMDKTRKLFVHSDSCLDPSYSFEEYASSWADSYGLPVLFCKASKDLPSSCRSLDTRNLDLQNPEPSR
jgi:hypothetical protein